MTALLLATAVASWVGLSAITGWVVSQAIAIADTKEPPLEK